MSELIRKPYKITLWEDKNVYITRQPQKGDVNFDGAINNKDRTRLGRYLNNENVEIDEWAADIDNNNVIDNNDLSLIDSTGEQQELINNPILKPLERKSTLSEHDLVQNQYLEEVCIATIGSNTMDTPIRAFNPILTEELNGSKTLTFQINYRYWDDEEEEFKLNPFINLLVNERKVKLQYGKEEVKYQLGDINRDGIVDIKDSTYLTRYINGWRGYYLDAEQQILADINQDGIIGALDRTILARMVNDGTASSLPYLDKKPIWYDFIIKEVQEDSENGVFTYICKDLFINELGKTGYEVELDTELRNNMGTITELASSILEGTDWQVDEENCDDLIQRNKEGLYSYITESSIEATNILTQSSKTIPSGKIILVFYSCKANKENPIQFLYKEQDNYSTADEAIANFYKIDEYGFIIDADNYEFTFSGLGNLNTLDAFYNSLASSSYFGQKIIKKQEMHYLPQIDETCLVYTHYDKESAESGNPQENQWYELDDEVYVLTEDTEISSGKEYYSKNKYYCYSELEYASIAQVQNMLSNSSGFISTNGWVGDSNQDIVTLTTTGTNPVLRSIGLNGNVYNTGFYDNRATLSPKGFIKGEKYIVAVKGITLTNNPYIILIGKTGVTNATPLTFNKLDNDQTYSFTIPSELEGYSVKMAVCSETISYSSIINDYSDIRFYLNNDGNLVDCKVFKYRIDSESKMIVPDLEEDSNAIIQTRYNFFLESSIPNNAIYTKQDLTIAESLLDTTEGYEPVMIGGCKKVTSLTGSKSNRFNLIQSLCEAFECWAKFTIKHNDKGQIAYVYNKINNNAIKEGKRYYTWVGNDDAPPSNTDDFNFKIITEDMTPTPTTYYEKIYSKYVTFKEYIGDDNPIGFRYGVNLQSIQRNIVSDQIASKVIVQANSNEFAPNGSCTIQQSVLNPTGENALYNFQYFINHGLLDATSLYDDLYGTNGGLGFYTKMKEYNNSIQPKINELSEISKSLYTLNSRQTVYDALMEEATRLSNEASLELSSAGYSSSTGTVPTYITELRNEIESYENTKSYYNTLSIRNKGLLDAYTRKYNEISESLKAVRALKDKLNQDFANKYYRFIQEGTWNSEDYWDPELYYQAANMVLYTSSFPQISYSINVLELSQIEGFEAYKFKIADKTYIEDTEFFGYDSKGRPYKEEIVVSQVTRHLDDNSQNTITVQNYKTQFQDLFQRIAAASQSLQYHEGSYQRAASAINNDGTINSALLQNSLEANALVIQNANNQSVTWDETGITISNFINANEIVRLTSNGIVLSTDGGKNWTTGITGNGINADVITAGRIDTDRIRIFNGAMQQTFEWNSSGINAYMQGGSFIDNGTTIGLEANQVNYGKFVRFDQYGLYGYAGGDPNWSPGQSGITKVISDSIFSLTWKGLSINVPTGSQTDPVIRIGSSSDPSNTVFQVDASGNITLKGNITWGSNNMPQTDVTSQNVYDAIISDNGTNGKFGLFNTSNNQLILRATAGVIGGWTIANNSLYTGSGSSYVGINSAIDSSVTNYSYAFWAGATSPSSAPFSVTKSGTLTCSSANVSGSITANTLNIKTGRNTYTNILSVIDSSTEEVAINMQYATGDFSGTFSGSINSTSLVFKSGNRDYGTIGYNNYGIELVSEAGIRIMANYYSSSYPGNVYLSADGTTDVILYGSEAKMSIAGNIVPGSDNSYTSGASGYRWKAVYCVNSSNSTSSDKREKNSIQYDLSKYESFLKDLKPVSYRYNTEENGKKRFGFIAQDIEEALVKNNLDSNDMSFLVKEYNEEKKDYIYNLIYGEFIALQQWQIQKLESRISALENLISSQNSDIL